MHLSFCFEMIKKWWVIRFGQLHQAMIGDFKLVRQQQQWDNLGYSEAMQLAHNQINSCIFIA